MAHSVVPGANDTANIIHTLDGGVADAVFNDTLESSGKCADLALSAVITNNNILFNGAVANGRDKGGAGSGKAVYIHIHLCPDQAGFEGFGAGFQCHIFNDDSESVLTCKANAVEPIHQAVAVDLLAVDVQVFDRGVLNIGQQRLSTLGNGQQLVVAQDGAGKSTEVIFFIGIPGVKFIGPIHRTADRRPTVRQGDVGNKLEKYSLKRKAGIYRIPQVLKICNGSNLVGVCSGSITFHVGFPRIRSDLHTLCCCGRACLAIKSLVNDAIIPHGADCICRHYKAILRLTLKQFAVTIVVDCIAIPLVMELHA